MFAGIYGEYAFGELGDRCFAMRTADLTRDRGRSPASAVLDLATVLAGPGVRPLPRRLRRRRDQGRAAGHRRQHAWHGRAATRPTARRCTGSSSARNKRCTTLDLKADDGPGDDPAPRRRRPRPGRELPARHARAPRARARRAARAQPVAGDPAGHRVRPGRALRRPRRLRHHRRGDVGFAAINGEPDGGPLLPPDRAHRRGHRPRRRVRHDGGAVVRRRARWST